MKNSTILARANSLIESTIHNLEFLHSMKGYVSKGHLRFHTKHAKFKLKTAMGILKHIDEDSITGLDKIAELVKEKIDDIKK